jgi:hypothetical protein
MFTPSTTPKNPEKPAHYAHPSERFLFRDFRRETRRAGFPASGSFYLRRLPDLLVALTQGSGVCAVFVPGHGGEDRAPNFTRLPCSRRPMRL